MTLAGLVTAVAVGLLVGAVGPLALPGRHVPRRLAVPVGVGAAVLGTLGARVVGAPAAGFGLSDVAAPVLFAIIGVAVLAR